MGKLGHVVRLIPLAYVTPFTKCQKSGAADFVAIYEAALRPTMRFVPVKSDVTKRAAMDLLIREFLIRQRTQAINALCGHLTEFGQIVPQEAAKAGRSIKSPLATRRRKGSGQLPSGPARSDRISAAIRAGPVFTSRSARKPAARARTSGGLFWFNFQVPSIALICN